MRLGKLRHIRHTAAKERTRIPAAAAQVSLILPLTVSAREPW
jgi:hypothetical protein